MSKIITLEKSELENKPFINEDGDASFYRLLAQALDIDWDTMPTNAIDPRKIYVAPSLVTYWFDTINLEEETLSSMILIYGPKQDDALAFNQVRIDD